MHSDDLPGAGFWLQRSSSKTTQVAASRDSASEVAAVCFKHQGIQLPTEITRIRQRRGRRDEIELSLDGREKVVLKGELAAGLRVGQRLSDSELAQLIKRDQLKRFYDKSIRFLSYRSRSEQEVRRYLQQKGATEDVRDEVIQQLSIRQYLDDQGFASEWVSNRAEFRPKGKRLLEAELRAKGISRDTIASALMGYDEERAARSVASKAARRFAHLPWENYQKKFVGYLSRRGFPYSLARQLAEITWNEKKSADESEVET